jgi:Pregnancy-associated plasma protein-A/Secretion system C-terminal sorting domain
MFLHKITLAAALLFFPLTVTQAQHRCGTSSIDENGIVKTLPLSKIPNISGKTLSAATTDTLWVPVVVHILYNTSEQNISDNQIQSQIDVLNEDYAGTNGTAAEVPDNWKPLVTDSKIRFRLAQRTPSNTNTNGITRRQTPITSFQYNDNSIKYTATGGTDAWPNDSYLNIWVCNLQNGVLGFASFPGGTAEEDGIVIHYNAFGRTGTLNTRYDFGRSATHEVGHWFSLIHIWGDTPDCSLDDQVDDTPLQADANLCCPKYPKYDNCTSNGDGIMFMNYMDYSDDKFMQFFTPEQIARMDTAINDYRSNLFLSNGGSEVQQRSLDLSVEEIMNPVRESTNRCFVPVVKVKNRGTTSISKYKLMYGIYEGNIRTIEVNEVINSGEERLITLPEISGSNGQNILEVRIFESDSNTVNNYATRSFFSKEDNTSGCTDGDPVIYPNPVTGTSFCVKSNFVKSVKLTIRLVNLLGQTVYETESTSNPGDLFSVPTKYLTRGIYFVQLASEDESRSASILFMPDESGTAGGCE